MRVDVIPVGVGCHYNFEAGDLLRQLQGDFMGHLWGDRIIWMEGLHHVIVHPTFGAVVQTLGVQKFLQSALRHTVNAGDQRSALVVHLGILAAVVDDGIESAHGLGALAFHKVNDCHDYHRFRLRMSDSKELTCAYAAVSSRR